MESTSTTSVDGPLDPINLPPPGDWNCAWPAGPLGLAVPRGVWSLIPEEAADPDATHAMVTLCAYESGDVEADRVGIPVPLVEEHWTPRQRRDPRWTALQSHAINALVYTTGGDAHDRAANLAAARYWQQLLWYHGDLLIPLVSDGQFGDKPSRYSDRPLVFGTPESNTAEALADGWTGEPPETDEVRIRFPDGTDPIGFAWTGSPDAARLLLAVDPFDGPVMTASEITLSKSSSGGLVIR